MQILDCRVPVVNPRNSARRVDSAKSCKRWVMVKAFGRSFRKGALAAAGAALMLPQLASAQLFLVDPDFKRGPIDPSDPLVGLPVPGATPAEYRAHLLWNMRAGLNVAALQCQ